MIEFVGAAIFVIAIVYLVYKFFVSKKTEKTPSKDELPQINPGPDNG